MTALRTFNRSHIEVIDPLNRTGKIRVPESALEETRGLLEYCRDSRSRTVKDLSLCLLFQKGRCNAGSRCHQIHVTASYIERLRAEAASACACCAFHGDVASASLTQLGGMVSLTDAGKITEVPLPAFGRTAPLELLLQSGKGLKVPQSKVCRLHSAGQCKFGRDCKNYHLCQRAVREIAAQQVSEASATTAPDYSTATGNSTPARSVSVSDHSMTDSPLRSMRLDTDAICCALDAPLLSVGSGSTVSPFFSAAGFESTLSLVCEDLAALVSSPFATASPMATW